MIADKTAKIFHYSKAYHTYAEYAKNLQLIYAQDILER